MKKLIACFGGLLLVLSCSSSGEASPTEQEVIVSKSEEYSEYLKYSVFIGDTIFFPGVTKQVQEKIGDEELKSIIKTHVITFCENNGLHPVDNRDDAVFSITATLYKIDIRDCSEWMTYVGATFAATGLLGSALNIWKDENPEESWALYLGASILSAGQFIFNFVNHTFEATVKLSIRLEDDQHCHSKEETAKEIIEDYKESVGYLNILNDALNEIFERSQFRDLCRSLKRMHQKDTARERKEDVVEDTKKKYNTFRER